MERSELPPGYRLDEGHVDFVLLIGPGDRHVAVFSSTGASKDAIEEAAKKDLQDGSSDDGNAGR